MLNKLSVNKKTGGSGLPTWREHAVSLQVLAMVFLFFSLIGQIRPANSLVLINAAGPEGALLLVFLLLFITCRFVRLHLEMPLLLALLVSLTGNLQSATDTDLIGWVMLAGASAASVLLAAEHLLLRLSSGFFWLLFAANGCGIVWLYLDRMFYTVSKTHLSFNHMQQLPLIRDYFFEALQFAGKGYQMLLAEMLIFLLLVLPAALLLQGRARQPGYIRSRKGLLLKLWIALAVMFLTIIRFDASCSKLPVHEYLPLRLDLGIMPVPDHPLLRAAPELRGLLQQPLTIDERRCYPPSTFASATAQPLPNLVMISVESLRRAEFAATMPRLKSWAAQGLSLAMHQSVTNVSLSSFHSIFHGSFPLNLAFSRHVTGRIPFQEFLAACGHRNSLIVHSPAMLQRSSFWEGNLDLASATTPWQSGPAVLDQLFAALSRPGRQAIHAYLYNLHFNYYYPPEAELFRPVLPEDTNLFLLQPDGNNLAGLQNRYKNAALYVDQLLDAFLTRAAAAGYLNNTLFVIFGDHGESLGEAGFITHATGPHISQFEVPVLFLGAGVQPRLVTTPTTHADLLPIICNLLGVEVKNTFGTDLRTARDWPVLQLDESVSGRIIVRHRDYMSIFDLAGGRRLKWLATVANDFTINAVVAPLYTTGSFARLAAVIKADADFIKSRIGKTSQ
ncbi:MAG TPA: sulfatase-like hydrolase/transferase [Candidatus Rifleibacterium sp.]|nr:sulfatase-like hydrolase/transferase [Candidatus Rifleibacterium sp.]